MKQAITFMKVGKKLLLQLSSSSGLLSTAQDRQLKVNLLRQHRFPHTIPETTLRPDIVSGSAETDCPLGRSNGKGK